MQLRTMLFLSESREEICQLTDPSVATTLPMHLRGPLEVKLASLVPDVAMADLSSFKMPFNSLSFGESLGKGGFGEVFKGVYNGQTVAIKRLMVDLSLDEVVTVFREFRREVWLSSTLHHPCIVKMKGCCINPCCCIVLEYIANGNLMNFLERKSTPISWGFRLKIALNIAEGLRFLHNRIPKIIHRDLKSPNCLMVSLSENDDIVCKLTDFGESLTVATKASGRANVANPAWCAPEVMRGLPYTEKADIFSMGILLWELASRQLPYSEFEVSKSRFVSQFEDAILDGLRPTIPIDCPEFMAALIVDCWKEDPDLRPPIEEISRVLARSLKEPNASSFLPKPAISKLAQPPPSPHRNQPSIPHQKDPNPQRKQSPLPVQQSIPVSPPRKRPQPPSDKASDSKETNAKPSLTRQPFSIAESDNRRASYPESNFTEPLIEYPLTTSTPSRFPPPSRSPPPSPRSPPPPPPPRSLSPPSSRQDTSLSSSTAIPRSSAESISNLIKPPSKSTRITPPPSSQNAAIGSTAAAAASVAYTALNSNSSSFPNSGTQRAAPSNHTNNQPKVSSSSFPVNQRPYGKPTSP